MIPSLSVLLGSCENGACWLLCSPEDLSARETELPTLCGTNGWLSFLLSGPEAIRHLQILFISK